MMNFDTGERYRVKNWNLFGWISFGEKYGCGFLFAIEYHHGAIKRKFISVKEKDIVIVWRQIYLGKNK